MDTAPSLEQQRIEIGTQNREYLTDKFRLNENQELFQKLSSFGKEAAHQAVPQLQTTTSPQEFGKVLDVNVVDKIKQEFGSTKPNGQEDPDAYGTRAGKAYIERVGSKARDELSTILKSRGIDTPDSRRVLDVLPLSSNCEQIGILINELITNIPEFSSQSKQLFELGKAAKIKEFEDFYSLSKKI